MWCKICQQDVPGIVSAGAGHYRCPRCGEGIDATSNGDRQNLAEAGCAERPADEAGSGGIRLHSQDHTSQMGRPATPSSYDGLAVEENLRELGRILTVDDEVEDPSSIPCQQWFRLDGSHAEPAGWRTTSKEDRFNHKPGSNSPGDSVISKVPWAVLSLGVATFACGGVLMIWSIVAGRQELWSTGIPLLLVGQIGLLVGLILQLDRLWHENRHTAAKVERLDHRLHESKASRHSPAEPGGADQILANLRGQLDLLSEEISREDSRQA